MSLTIENFINIKHELGYSVTVYEIIKLILGVINSVQEFFISNLLPFIPLDVDPFHN